MSLLLLYMCVLFFLYVLRFLSIALLCLAAFLLVFMFNFFTFFLDLVPKDNVEKWLKYLRNELPTVAFKASTQSQKQKLVCLPLFFIFYDTKLYKISLIVAKMVQAMVKSRFTCNSGSFQFFL